LPIAPAGAQNAPGVTINELLLSTGVGVGDAEGVADGVTTGVGVTNDVGVGVGVIVGVVLTVGVALTIGVGVGEGVGVFEVPRPQKLINVFNFVASFVSIVKEYLVFIAIQFWV
jgi:hypothetical protein